MKKTQKEPKRKPKYGLLSCVGYIYRYLWKNERRLALHGLFTVIITVAAAAVALYTPSFILEALERASAFRYVALVIVGLLIAGFVAELAGEIVSVRNQTGEIYLKIGRASCRERV